jgi:hypothetical protein
MNIFPADTSTAFKKCGNHCQHQKTPHYFKKYEMPIKCYDSNLRIGVYKGPIKACITPAPYGIIDTLQVLQINH